MPQGQQVQVEERWLTPQQQRQWLAEILDEQGQPLPGYEAYPAMIEANRPTPQLLSLAREMRAGTHDPFCPAAQMWETIASRGLAMLVESDLSAAGADASAGAGSNQ